MVKGLKQMADAKVVINKLHEHMTLKEIAIRVGVHVQTVYMWRMGTYRPSEANIKKLLEILDGALTLQRTEERIVVPQTQTSDGSNSEPDNSGVTTV